MTGLHALLAGASLAAAFSSSSTAAAQAPVAPAVAIPDRPVAVPGDGVSRPRYVIEATSFKALNETGVDFLGSDEIIVRYAINDRRMFTGIYGDVDTGETHNLRSGQQCIYPAADPDGTLNHTWTCTARGASGPVSFQITLYEYDGPLRHFFTLAGFCIAAPGDDLTNSCDNDTPLRSLTVGHGYVTLSEAELATELLTVGASFTRVVAISDSYQVNVRVTRVPGLLVPPVGDEPPLHPGDPVPPCVSTPGNPCP